MARKATKSNKNLWISISDSQAAARKAFFKQQAARSEQAPNNKYWSAVNDDQNSARKAFFNRQVAKLANNKYWSAVNDSQSKARNEFFAAQKALKAKQTANHMDYKAKMKAAQLTSTSSQWTTGKTYGFHVAIPTMGISMGNFRRVSGIVVNEMDFETYREGGDNGPEHYLPTHSQNGRITLEWALRFPDPFIIYCITMGTGVMLSHAVNITLVDNKTPVAMWTIPQAMISKIEAPELDAMSSDVATNKIEMIHAGLIPIPVGKPSWF